MGVEAPLLKPSGVTESHILSNVTYLVSNSYSDIFTV